MADQPDAAAMQAAYGKIVAKAWTDEAFKQRLLRDPAAVLEEEGVEVPTGVTVKVVENSGDIVHLVLPPRPPEGELSDEDLEAVSAGRLFFCVTIPDFFHIDRFASNKPLFDPNKLK